ncbi:MULTISPECIES: energy transducer TonB [unclassified Salinisphaera]|uniref:energy transducer TonB family protein n=1 Tax=unclassified Salinisphaera TaxID=2649847 RepID=UPI00333ED1C5
MRYRTQTWLLALVLISTQALAGPGRGEPAQQDKANVRAADPGTPSDAAAADEQTERERYYQTLYAHLRQSPLRYPPTAAEERVEGTARVRLEVAGDGHIAAGLAQSSGDSRLDAAALAAMQLASPAPAWSDDPTDSLTVVVPLMFRLNAPTPQAAETAPGGH